MRLSGALSNPQANPRLNAAARAFMRGSYRSASAARVRPLLRLPMGAIQTAVRVVLEQAEKPMRPCDVHAAVERVLGRRVSQDTVGSFLSVAARRTSMPIERVGPGRYAVCGR
jgi:hypothetical protein